MSKHSTAGSVPEELRRTIGLPDAVMIGLGSMIGAGIFAALAPAAHAAGAGLLIGLVLAAVVAYCNATSSARLAAWYPVAGGTYVYGRECLGEFWGYLAGCRRQGDGERDAGGVGDQVVFAARPDPVDLVAGRSPVMASSLLWKHEAHGQDLFRRVGGSTSAHRRSSC